MTRRSLIVLGVVGAMLVAVLLLTRLDFPSDDSLGALHAPGLADRLGELESLRVTRAGNEVVATIERSGQGWGVAERGGHPVDFERFRGSLLALSEARRVERKTALPEFYPRIGVEDVSAPDAGGYLFELGYGGSRPEDRFILGNRAGTGMIYIRTAGEEQSWMVSAELSLSDETRDWVDRDIIDLGSGEVRRVELDRGDGDRLEIAKEDRDDINFTPRDIPEGRELSYGSVANSIAGALANVEANDVRPAAEVAGLARAVLALYETFDGLELELDVREELPAGAGDDEAAENDTDPRYWVLFSAGAAEAADREEPTVSAVDAAPETSPVTAKERAGELNAALAGWAYELPGYKSDQWFKKMDDLLRED
ncbi:MAG: DUF4340 domain-containing protein [Gammaproteobacteria bacterium]|nr:DUF4340 domain-containing protein [Gammaproteobacteria bacterium]MXW44908.1 DUF4340 domain-containing protein [Gammaproteobacteria bacterium]MYD02086.1 DUF4340 domain-containing protein [Gammaproteobacteria bacterium]MYI24290.1 DUF4340 domain-containing protein [Gammaproteobacteria bacterium]